MTTKIITDTLPMYQFNSDIVTLALCILMGVLLYMTQERRNSTLKILYVVIMQTLISAVTNILFHITIETEEPKLWLIYPLRFAHHFFLMCALLMYTLYLFEALWLPQRMQRQHLRFIAAVSAGTVILDILGSVFGFGFQIQKDGAVHQDINFYAILFSVLIGFIIYLIIRYKSRLLRQVFISLIGTNLLTVLLLIIEGKHNNNSYTTFAYFIPIIGLIFMFHSNPFNVETGAMSDTFFTQELEEQLARGNNLFIIVCHIRGFFDHLKNSKEFKTEYYSFLRTNIKKGVLYSSADGRLILMQRVTKDMNANEIIDGIHMNFLESFNKFQHEYKIVIAQTDKDIRSAKDYVALIDEAEAKMPYNEAHFISEEDIKRFYASSYILAQLADIAHKNSLTDERVLVYCQPIYNLATGRFDTAESLMRLKLEKTGMVYPDQFIPLAEQHNYIHTLSMIILDKTCAAIRDFMEEGYEIQRASVNFSTTDLRYNSFCKEIQHIIDRNGIPYDKIAVEITESQSEADFNLLKEKVKELQKLGIKFYLDDFGTGYSNFERIMEIPFDIIKFDRSMLIELAKSETSRFMVNTFADMFHKLEYTVLFEGVENDTDQETCIKMNASYLQGYKFSRPIPIGELRNFLSKSKPSDKKKNSGGA